MKVCFDHQIFTMQRYGGISRYFANICNSLEAREDAECKLLVLYSRNQYIQDRQFPMPPFLAERLLKKYRKQAKWNEKYARRHIQKSEFDVLHPTYYHPYFLEGLKKPFVITVHDMIHELFPEYFSTNEIYVQYKRETITRADHLIAISESTKNDLQRIYNIPEEKITVVYHGYQENPALLHADKDTAFTLPFREYVLFVGDRAGYKNFGRFVQAVKPVLERYDINLVCAGGGDFGVAEKEMLYRAGIQNRAKQISATETQLNSLYQNALAFIYPSLYEGFGLPILEAFRNNCPIITSNTSCFQEVGGEAAVYFDPYQIDEMAQSIDAVINSKELSGQLRAKGAQRLGRFSMERCMEGTMDVYRKLV
ncbi:glycosyltransferase family 1 protein [Chitinophaga sp.]|uniref:glycosyltransferase family 4 protein n=1 Tax=Chitinophaga sp. TaxID=1869181 RepID=UPI00262DE5F7|nr:glycosyltransferase family 1 protein [uncultured Chitinophaga sp.]